ncbi:Uncharacterized protein HZ326_19944 [Fusarium oxysporum f. sp. albedinis]|nr:Uncharacterized protein HZ326_19944 [Fusarium oxysporum f. sp. albedinis]
MSCLQATSVIQIDRDPVSDHFATSRSLSSHIRPLLDLGLANCKGTMDYCLGCAFDVLVTDDNAAHLLEFSGHQST